MRLAKPATVSDFERLKPPYIGVTADSVIRIFCPFFKRAKPHWNLQYMATSTTELTLF